VRAQNMMECKQELSEEKRWVYAILINP
jgi:hypothetical protein